MIDHRVIHKEFEMSKTSINLFETWPKRGGKQCIFLLKNPQKRLERQNPQKHLQVSVVDYTARITAAHGPIVSSYRSLKQSLSIYAQITIHHG